MLWISVIFTLVFVSSGSSANEISNVHVLDPGETFHFNSKGPIHLEIFCYKGKPKNIIYIWQTIILQLIHHTDDFSMFEGFDPGDVKKQYAEKQSFWSINIFSPRQRSMKLNPFNTSCVGIESRETYTVKLNVIVIDFWKVSLLIVGLFLFLSAETLSKNVIFHYICGVSVGITASLLILIYLVSKIFPRKPFMYGIIGCGWTVVIYALQLIWANMQTILTGYKLFVVWYIIGTGLLSFIFCYRWGPVENKRTINLIRWSMQLLGLVTIFNSSHYQEAAMGQIVTLLIAYNMPQKWVVKPKMYWRRKFPPKIPLLTEDEFHQQAVRETAKALEELRKFCASPECNQWKTVTKLKNVKRFASFVEGNSHLSDEEILEYETSVQGEITDDEHDDELTDEEY
ncbi:unnamed protein product [Phaedon cochleariae]|uniref:Nuclear envelope integral membrane protein 1 n=1 Tax=Phaedon cochleariae TaxID=80249 RepID=A0A9N9X1I0_PHACE|nr:unnamed protein product [Phaedon cochleariae]